MNLRGVKIKLHDMSLRDGMHPKRHQITLEQMIAVSTALDDAGVPLIEVTHGDGLGGASINYGFPLHSDEEYLRAVVPRMKRARISALLLPGIGTIDDLRMAVDCGVGCVRVATHCTEADVAAQHIGLSRKLGADTVGFLMMAQAILRVIGDVIDAGQLGALEELILFAGFADGIAGLVAALSQRWRGLAEIAHMAQSLARCAGIFRDGGGQYKFGRDRGCVTVFVFRHLVCAPFGV